MSTADKVFSIWVGIWGLCFIGAIWSARDSDNFESLVLLVISVAVLVGTVMAYLYL